MSTISLWKSITDKKQKYPSVQQDIEVDVAIVGAGITGIITAWQLVNAGLTVAILEKDEIGYGTTGFSTGNLYIPVQPLYQHIQSKFDLPKVLSIINSRKAAIDLIEQIVLQQNIHCHFQRRPWFLYSNDPNKEKVIEKEYEILSKALEVTKSTDMDIPYPYKKAIKLENQARFNPLAFVVQLAEKLAEKDCQIFENSTVLEMEEQKSGCTLKTSLGKVKAKKVVIATHTPIGINAKQQFMGPYRSYVVAAKVAPGKIPNGNYWDLESPHHAMSTHSSGSSLEIDIVAVAGSHHKTGQSADAQSHFSTLESFLKKGYEVESIAYRWSAQHYQAADFIPYIGPLHANSQHILMGTGYFADGLVYGTVAGMIISDQILEKDNPWASVYDSTRFTPMASAPSFLKENINVFGKYFQDFPGTGERKSKNEIKPGEGKIIEHNMEKLAVSREDNGALHVVSAVCTHMKCIVKWNNAEKTWDCPCHGSRFACDGKVIEGPAILPLAKKDLP